MEKISYTEFIDNIVEKAKDSNQILYATVELTTACNFRCKHCYLGSKENFKFIDTDKLFKLLDELKEMGCVSLIITGGEPLMHPDFKKIYMYAKKKGFLITLFTNGYLLDDDIIDMLSIYKPTMIEISLYGTDDSSYKDLTKRKIHFEKIKNNIKKITKNNIRVRLKTVLLKQTINQIDKMKEIANQLNCDFRWDYYVINSLNDDNELIDSTKLTEDEIISKILKDKPKYDLFKSTIKSNFEENDRLYKCGAGKNSIYISSDLLLSICVIAREPYYDLKKGNLNEGISIVRNFGCTKMPSNSPCGNCENINICRYCPSKFKISNNDYCKPIEKYCNIASKMRNIINLENNIKIKIMNKQYALQHLDEMYKIISTNMNKIFSIGNSNEENYKNWKKAMMNELENKNKRWVGAFLNDKMIGYFLYKVNDNNINLDEIQIIDEHKSDKCTFIKLLKTLLKDEDIENYYTITTYVNKNNCKSNAIVRKFKFKELEVKKNGIKYISNFSVFKEEIEKYVIC